MPTLIDTNQDLLEIARQRVDDLRRLQAAGLICKSGDFYPSVHYPPITMYQPMTQEELFRTFTMPADGMLDVYMHIPFCEMQCVFCHYPVKLGKQLAEKDRYLTALEKEMDIYMRLLGIDIIKVRSVLIGGGTPTYLTLPQLERFLKYFTRRCDLSKCEQFNYDVDPNTMTGPEGLERLRIMKDYGVNRLTVGVQSLSDMILKKMCRPHNAARAIEAVRNCLEFGYIVNIEFIFGYPGQTLENWMEVMEKAVTLGVDEIQLYRLKVEAYGDHQGAVKKYKQIKPSEVPSPENSLMMKQLAISILSRNGYHENLRRVFSKKREHYSVYAHDQCCNLQDQIGLGLTGFSSLRDRFGLNTQYFDEYYRCIDEGRLPLNRGIVRSQEEQIRWSIILPLKNRDVWKPTFQERTGVSLDTVFRKKIEKLKASGLVTENATNLALTPLGCFFADEVAQQFQHPRYMPFPPDAYERGPLHPLEDCQP